MNDTMAAITNRPLYCKHEGCPMETDGKGGYCEKRLPFGQAWYGTEGTPCDRWICTPETPWGKGKGRAIHPYAKEVRDSQSPGWPAGDTVRERCPVCEHSWRRELAQ